MILCHCRNYQKKKKYTIYKNWRKDALLWQITLSIFFLVPFLMFEVFHINSFWLIFIFFTAYFYVNNQFYFRNTVTCFLMFIRLKIKKCNFNTPLKLFSRSDGYQYLSLSLNVLGHVVKRFYCVLTGPGIESRGWYPAPGP